MRTSRTAHSLLKLAAIVAMLAFASIGSAVSAQEENTFSLGVVVVNCDVNAPAQITVPEDGCAPATGIEINATDATGSVISTCISDVAIPGESFTGGCSLEIPFGSTVTVTENMATVPAGYAPLENAQAFTAPDAPPTGFLGGPIFVNMLQDGGESVIDTGSGVAEDGLPNTGTGASQPAITSELGVMLVIGVAMLGAAVSSRWISSE